MYIIIFQSMHSISNFNCVLFILFSHAEDLFRFEKGNWLADSSVFKPEFVKALPNVFRAYYKAIGEHSGRVLLGFETSTDITYPDPKEFGKKITTRNFYY